MKKTACLLAFLTVGLISASPLAAQVNDARPGAANPAPKMAPEDMAWLNVRAAVFTGDFSKTLPTDPEARKAAMARHAAQFTSAADRAKDFYTTYPEHPKVSEARSMEVQALIAASKAGDATGEGRLSVAVEELRADPKVPTPIKAKTVGMHAFSQAMRGQKSRAERLAAIEKVARDLTADFPTEPQGYESLLTVALSLDDETRARQIAQDLLSSPSGDAVKQSARTLVKRLEMVGKPIGVELAGADAKEARAAVKQGQATLIYTWASWSPGSLALAAKLKERGVKGNVIALNVDQDQQAAMALAAKESLLGTVVYDDRGLEGALAQRLMIKSAPQVIIVDAQGIIREVRGEADLEKKLKQHGL